MSKIEKIKRLVLVLVGFGFSAYLLYNGVAILNQEDANASNKVETQSSES